MCIEILTTLIKQASSRTLTNTRYQNCQLDSSRPLGLSLGENHLIKIFRVIKAYFDCPPSMYKLWLKYGKSKSTETCTINGFTVSVGQYMFTYLQLNHKYHSNSSKPISIVINIVYYNNYLTETHQSKLALALPAIV